MPRFGIISLLKAFFFCARKVEIYSIRNTETGERRYYLDIGRYLGPGTYRGGELTVTAMIWSGFSYHLFRRASSA